MITNELRSTGKYQSSQRSRPLLWTGVTFALVFPTIITWWYFVFAGRYSTTAQQTTYIAVKAIQFGFPLVWVWLVLRERMRIARPQTRGILLGVVFSVIVVAAGWLLFDLLLRDASVFSAAATLIHEKIRGFGIDRPWKYIVLAAFYSTCHSLLEEYYWRWFAFGQLRRLVRLWPAILISALAFMGHHVVVLGEFFKDTLWLAWLFSLAVAMGGVFWAWLYERSGSLIAPWISHLLLDAGIFWVGYELVRPVLAAP